MDILSTVILGITAFFLLFGLLFGVKRGAFRSIVRLILVGASFAVAYFGKSTYVKAIWEIELEGQTIGAALSSGLGEGAAFAGVLIPLIESLLGVILFILVFIALKIVTVILFFFIAFFLPKPSNRGLGALIGLVQGALIAFCICAPLNGIIGNAAQLMNLELGGEPVISAEDKAMLKENGIDFEAYMDGPVCGLYTSLGDSFYRGLASSQTEDGKNVSLSGTVEAIEAGTKFIGALESVSTIDMSNGLTAESREELLATFKELDTIKDGMSEDAKETINTLITTVIQDAAGEAEIPEEVVEILENLDFANINFEQEGGLVIDFMDYAESGEESDVTVTDLVNGLAESTVILPMIEEMTAAEGGELELPEAQKAEAIAAINNLQDAEMQETLRKIFGLN